MPNPENFDDAVSVALAAADGRGHELTAELILARPWPDDLRPLIERLFCDDTDAALDMVCGCAAVRLVKSGSGRDAPLVETPPRVVVEKMGKLFAKIHRLTLTHESEFLLCDARGVWYGVDRPTALIMVQQLCNAVPLAVEGVSPTDCSGRTFSNVLATAEGYAEPRPPARRDGLLPFRDGFAWDIPTRTRRAITAADGVRVVIDADCPETIPTEVPDLLEPWVPDYDDADLFSRWIASTAMGGNRAKSVCLLEGASDSGKSTLIRLLTRFCWGRTGSLRVAHLDGRFELAQLAHAAVSIDPDAKTGTLKRDGVEMIKTLTGGDHHYVERKGVSGGRDVLFAMHVLIATNHVLEVESDPSAAWLNRIIRIPTARAGAVCDGFEKSWAGLYAPHLGPWLLFHALAAHDDIARTGHLRRTEQQTEAVRELTGSLHHNLIEKFLIEKRWSPSRDNRDAVKIGEIKRQFEAWAKARQEPDDVIKALKREVPGIMKTKHGFSYDNSKSGIRIQQR